MLTQPPVGAAQAAKAHGSTLRKGRVNEAGRAYLITAVTASRTPLFTDFNAARAVVNSLRKSDQLERSETLAFVVMPDHLHWLMQLRSNSLSGVVGSVKASAARAINVLRGTAGEPCWQAGFHDHALRGDAHLADTARYVVANPLRAGLVARLADYPHWDAVWL
jgi:putative transposase